MRSGSLLLEAIIAIGIFSIFLGGIGLSLLVGERSTIVSGDRSRAAFLAEEQLEAIRHMRNAEYASIETGTYGVALDATGWTFSGTSVVTNGYRTNVDIVSKGADWLEVTSTVRWNFGNTRSGTMVLTTYLTNWQKLATIGNWEVPTRIANVTDGGTPEYQSIAVSGIYAFLTSTQATGGKGLYIFDVTYPSAPVRVASSFDLGASAFGIAAVGNRLYLATDNPVQEVQVYDITAPASLTTANLINSFDVAGEGKARSIAVYGDNIFIGNLHDGTNNELTALLMSETDPMDLQSSLAISGSVLAVALQDGYGYVASDNNAGELIVVDIFDPENMSFAPGTGIDMPDVHDAVTIATSGTSALIGRMAGSGIDELTLYEIGFSPVPSPPPGPWTLELGGTVNALATVYGSRYGFVGGDADAAQLRVIDLWRFALGQPPILWTFDAEAVVRGLYYDWLTDRLFAVTPDSLMVFAPGS